MSFPNTTLGILGSLPEKLKQSQDIIVEKGPASWTNGIDLSRKWKQDMEGYTSETTSNAAEEAVQYSGQTHSLRHQAT